MAKSLNQFADAAPFQPMKVDPRTGLTERLTDLLRAEVRRFPEVRAAYLYGSRARGDYSPQSHIDIASDALEMTPQSFAQCGAPLTRCRPPIRWTVFGFRRCRNRH
jgi:Polymerase beta, Nucleotidyltransferase